MNLFGYNRIMIIGNNGSGKSYLASKLRAITGLPLVHLDVEFWRPNWEMPSEEEWLAKNIELVSSDKWILDGNVNHGGTMELRFKAADLVLLLDINRLVCLTGVIKRNGRKRPDTTAYPYEKFDKRFWELCKGIWAFPKTRKPAILTLHEKYPHKPLIVIQSRHALRKHLHQWQEELIR